MSVTVEELEILVKANITDALAGMTKLRDQMKKTLSAQLPNIQSQLAPVKQIVDQYGNAITSSAAKTQTAVQRTGDKVKQTAQATRQAVESVKKSLSSVADPLDGVKAKVKEAADEYAYLDDVIQRTIDRQKHESAGASLPTSGPRIPSATATENFARRKAASSDDTPMVDPEKLTKWQKFTAQYYTYLDNIKAALNKFGLYGKENIGKVKQYTDAATTSTKKYENQVRESTSKSKSMFGSLGQMIKRALTLTLLYQGFRKLFGFIKDGIKSAIDAPEIENLFRVALGNMSNQAADFAGKMKKYLGVDQYATKQMLGTFQNMTTSMGIGAKTAYSMSKSMTVLANDMASLYNVDPEQASENLQSALTGQGRAVRKYGYVITEAAIAQTAYKYGLAQTGAELTEQQKVVARYLTLIDQSKNAHGDMARTLGSVQNQLRILKENVTAAGRSFGSAFIPFIQAAIPWLNAFMVVLQRTGVALSRWTYGLFGKNYDEEMKKQQAIITGYNGVASAEDEAGSAATKAGKAAEDAAKKAKGSLASFDEISVIQQPGTPSSENSGSGASGPGGGLDFNVPTLDVSKTTSPIEVMADKMQAAFAKIRQAAEPTIQAFNRFTKSLEPVKNFAAKAFEDFYKDYLVPLGKWVLGKGLPELLDIFTKFNKNVNWGAINKALDDLWKALEPFTENVGEGLLWFLDNVLRPIAEFGMNIVLPKLLEILATSIDILDQVIEKAKPAFQWFYDNFLVPLGNWTGKAISDDLNLICDVLKTLDDLLKGDMPAASKDGQKALNDLGQIIKDFTGIDIPGAVEDVKNKIQGFGAWWNEDIAKWWNENVIPWFTKEKWQEEFEHTHQAAQTKWNEVVDWWNSSTLVKWWNDSVSPWFTAEKWSDLYDTVKQSLSGKWNETVIWWNALGPVKWWNSSVSPWFTKDKWSGLYNNIKQALVDKWNEIVTWWNKTAIVNWWDKDVSPWFTAKKWTGMMAGVVDGFKATFKNAINAGIDLFNKFIDWINSKMKFSWDAVEIGGKKIFDGGSIQLFTIPPITPLATGGVLKQSTLVNVAEYPGAATNPEIVTPQKIMYDTVSSANGPLAVEILNALEELKNAVVTAINDKDLSTYIDGEQLERHQRPIREAENNRIGGTIFDI